MSLLLLIISFMFTGFNSISNRALVAFGLGDYRALYCLGFWGGGVILGFIILAIKRHEFRKKDAFLGIVMGATGATAMVFLLMSLQTVKGVVVFPVRSCGNVSLTAAISYFLWREKVTPRQWLGIACGVLVIYLLL